LRFNGISVYIFPGFYGLIGAFYICYISALIYDIFSLISFYAF